MRTKAKDAPGAKSYTWVTLFASIFSFAYALELGSTSFESMQFWLGIEYLFMPFIPVLVLFMCMEYVGLKKKTWYYLFFIIPIITVFMIHTNHLHHLYYKSINIDRAGTLTLLKLEWGLWFYVHAIFLFSCFMVSVLVLLSKYRQSLPIFRKQIILMVAGLITPIIANYFYLNNSSSSIDFGPVSLSITFLFHGVAILSLQMFSLAPIARENIFDSLKEGVMVVNLDWTMVDYNKAMVKVFPVLNTSHIGKTMKDIFRENPTLIEKLLLEKESDYTNFADAKAVHFRISFSDVLNKRGQKIGKIISFINVTEKVMMEEKLKQLASLDGLTQVLNRTFFIKKSELLLNDLHLDGGSLSIVMFDIDHFKRVNDTFGHEAGDLVLTRVSNVVKKSLQVTDYMGRFGGEEFIICMPDISLEEATNRANIIRQAIAGMTTIYKEMEITATSSFGVTHLQMGMGEDHFSIQQLIGQADEALYAAKRKGRNCVEIYESADIYVTI